MSSKLDSVMKEYLKNQLNRSLVNIKGELWKDIVGYEGVYRVSSLARIKRLKTTYTQKSVWGEITVNRVSRIHNYHINDRNMPRVQLSKNGINKIFSLSRLVAVAFVPNPKNLPIVCHKDDDPVNNYYKNLFWGTQQDNIDDKCNKNRQARGETNGRVKLKETQVIEIRNNFCGGSWSSEIKELAKKYNTTRQNISLIIKRKNWRHI